ncbi:LUD domain-containing protein [Ornithinicoccus halotolerans]|uniref:LUD domain-containing protein n=1 Tax=Ornithinicoccus halotolerans TaxID=1748220 RepID=UPI00188609D1|nr:LUD domain-containing protein [Ornithinicoccus halotolerans]
MTAGQTGAATGTGPTEPGGPGLVDTFTEELARRGGTTHRVADADAARELVHELCAGKQVVADDDPVLADVLPGLARVSDPWAADVGVTTAVAAGAATGTIGLVFDRDHPRRTALVPPAHVAVVPVERLHASYAEVLRSLAAIRPVPSGMRLISGPSSSGDIEQVHVRGMHGPVELHVVLVGAAPETTVPAGEGERAAATAEEAGTGAGISADPEPVAEPVREQAPHAAPGEHAGR